MKRSSSSYLVRLLVVIVGSNLSSSVRLPVALASPPASVLELEAPADLPLCGATAINDGGDVLGWCQGQGSAVPVIWRDGAIAEVIAIPSSDYLAPHAINNKGQIAGSLTGFNQPIHAMVWHDGTTTDLGTLGGGAGNSEAFAINDLGQVVGTSDTPPLSGAHAFLWEGGAMTDLGAFASSHNLSEARDINNRGQVVGRSFSGDSSRPVRFESGSLIDLGTLDGADGDALAINDRGDVVGWSGTLSGYAHAVLWRNGTIIDLGTLPGHTTSTAYDINARGEVVGVSSNNSVFDGDRTAFFWADGVMTPLGPPPGLPFSWALAINARGQVVGTSYNDGAAGFGPSKGVLWTPAR